MLFAHIVGAQQLWVRIHMTYLVIPQASLGPYAWERQPRDCESNVRVLTTGDAFSDGLPLDIDTPECRSRSPRRIPRHDLMKPSYLDDEDLKHCVRTAVVFHRISQEDHMSCQLPKAKATAGRILAHAGDVVETLIRKESPLTFKIGITHCPIFRWYHKPYGYKHGVEKFEKMVMLYASSSPTGPAFLEAALVDKYRSCSAKHGHIKAASRIRSE